MDLDVVAAIGTAVDERRYREAVCAERQGRSAAGRPGFVTEEGNEDSWDVPNVLVDQETVDPVAPKRTRELASGVPAAGNDLRAEAGPNPGRDVIQARIVHLSDGDGHRDPGRTETGIEKLPVSGMGGDEDGAAAAGAGSLDVLDAVDRDESPDILWVRPPKPRDLAEHRAEVTGTGRENASAVVRIEVREGELEMAPGAGDVAASEPNGGGSERRAGGSQETERQSAASGEENAQTDVEDVVTRGESAHAWDCTVFL